MRISISVFCKEISKYIKENLIFLNKYLDYFLLSDQTVSYIYPTVMAYPKMASHVQIRQPVYELSSENKVFF
jgi:hypothetical protein